MAKMTSRLLLFLVLFPSFFLLQTNAQNDSLSLQRKIINAVRIASPPKIDGELNEPFWSTLPVATNFVEYSPRNGIRAPFETEVRFAFDDVALYIGTILFDPHPDSICHELGRRDQIEQLNTDYISFDILPYNDALNMFEFKVSPANLQSDTRYSPVGQDVYWDAVWESTARITDSGWIVEARIPYSALRFPKVDKQVWGINMWRHIRRYQEWSTWCFVDNKVQELFNYYGELKGINQVDPPLRLSFSPYLTGYVEKNPDNKNWSWLLRGGMDVKLGITDSYTLDMMLIPDFGQVQSDDIILNLSPFEVRYDEKRQFFTEGTDLFDKCEIFYTRRVGSMPRNYFSAWDSLGPNEDVVKDPEETKIINATKISGRNARGLGLGFFNAMTTNTWAIIGDSVTGDTRRVSTQPFTNYNVMVVDQNLKNNSYVTLINTNYYIPDDGYSGNVTGTEAKFCNKKNTLSVFGRFIVSQEYQSGSEPIFGHRYRISVAKPSGKFQYEVFRDAMDNKYNPNDMGFLTNNNEDFNYISLAYKTFDPFWKINQTQTYFITSYTTLNTPNKFMDLRFELNHYTQFNSFWAIYLEGGIHPMGSDDFYEPRVWGYVYKRPLSYDFTWNVATDLRKPFRIHTSVSVSDRPENKNFSFFIGLIPRIRFSDRFTITLNSSYEKDMNDNGWVETQVDSLGNPTIYFGRRDVLTINNVLDARYIFNTKLSLSLRVRHYWSQVNYLQYYTLNHDGNLQPDDYWQDHNINFNAFTADLQFIWYFAPGSELSVVWKNLIMTSGNQLNNNYFNDLGETLGAPQTNSFSARILYYIDYQLIKKILRRKKQA